MIVLILTTLAASLATLAAPLAAGNKVVFSWEGRTAAPGTVHQYSEASRVPQYYLQPAQGVTWTPADRFTTFTVDFSSSSHASGRLVQGTGGQSVTPLPGGTYSITNPAREYANYVLPALASNAEPIELCVYIYKEPSSVPMASIGRNNFSLSSTISRLGLGDSVASSCLFVINGAVPSVTSTSTKTTSIISSSSKVSTIFSVIGTAPSSRASSRSVSTSTAISEPLSSMSASTAGPLPAYQTTVTFDGRKYINKGLVGFGAIDGDARDSRGHTAGGFGSAIAVQSIKKIGNTFTGTILAQPDRGHNTVGTVDYQARRHVLGFTLNPYYGSTQLEYTTAKDTFKLSYESSVFYHESDGTATTGLDPKAVRQARPPLPIASSSYNRISTDAEGLILNADGTSWVSDEYGPYIYKYSANGELLSTIQPPVAILPYYNGQLNSTSETPPTTGRKGNQGFEGLTASPDGRMVYALLQSGTIQDLDAKGEGRYTRFFAWNVEGTPALVSSYVFVLPVTNGKGKVLAQSEIHYLSDTTFLVLSRDGKGNGDDDSESKHKDFLLYSTADATDIAFTSYTQSTTPVSPKGVLVPSIVAAEPTEFIDIIDETQLSRFGLHNGGDFSKSLINSKWESIALASMQDPAFPNDYLLFSFSDNDFISLNGNDQSGAYVDPYASKVGYSLDNQALVWRVTLA